MATDIFGNPLDEEERFRQMMEQQRMGLMPGMLGGPAVDTFSDIPASLPAYGPAAGLGPSAYMGAPQGMPTYNQQPFQATPSIMVDAVTADPTGGLAATDPSLQGITPFSQASRTSSITPFASPSYASYDKGPGWDTSAISLQSAFNPTSQEDVSYWQAPKTEAPVPQVPQRQEVAPQVQARTPFVAPTYVAPAAPAPVDVEAIRSTVTAPFDFSDVSGGRLAKAREYAGQGMFGRAKQQIELGGGDWSKAMHRALKGETGMSSADLAKAKDAAVQQATLARQAQHAANVSAAQKKHTANVLAAQKRHAAKAKGAAAKAAARQAVIDAQKAAAAARAKAAADKAAADRVAAAAAARAAQVATGRQGDQGSDEYSTYSEGGVPMTNENLTWFGAAPIPTSPSMNVDYSAALDAIAKMGLSDDLSREIQRNYEAYRDSWGQPTATNPNIGAPSWGWMEPFAQALGIDPGHFERVEMIDKLHSLGLLDTPSNFTDDLYAAALKSHDLTSSGVHPGLVGLLGLQGIFTGNVQAGSGHMIGLIDDLDVMKAIDDAITQNVLGITIPGAEGDRDRAEVAIDPDQGDGPF